MWLIFTSEIFFDWDKLKWKLEEFYGLSKIESEYLFKKVYGIFMHDINEEDITQEFRIWLKRNFYEEMHLMLDLDVLKIIGKLFEEHNLVLITNLTKYSLVFKEHINMFVRIFSPQEYRKKIDDPYFAKIIQTYITKETKGNLSEIRVFSSYPQVCRNFQNLNILTKCVDNKKLKDYFSK